MHKILFIGSSPEQTAQLDLMRQFTDIQTSVYGSPLRDFTLELVYATAADLVKALRDHPATIVHFTGHASKAGIAMEGPGRPVLMVGLDDIGATLAAVPNPPRCVVLNGCDTADPPKALQDAVEFVIGWKGQPHQDAAILFADTFYSTVARGTSIGRAFALAREAVEMAYQSEEARPQLAGAHHDLAETTILTGQPAIVAEFLMNDAGMPKRKGKYFDVRLSIRNAPGDTYLAIYQLTDDYTTGEFEKVDSGERDFELLIEYWEDFEVKVVLWSPSGGVCLKRRVLDALRDQYPHPAERLEELLQLMVTA